MLSSKDILERTGISRATLNNYIAAGLLARPEVLPPGPNDGGAPRIGYFADDTIQRIETIQRLKRDGWSLGRILEHFTPGEPTSMAAPEPDPRPPARPDEDAPRMRVVAVLGVTLHDADSLWVTLPVQDYFALVTEVELELRRVVRRHQGQALRLAPYRFLCHFLPPAGDQLWRALQAANLLRDAITEVGARWKALRGWSLEIVPNAGLAVGEAWVNSGPSAEPQIVGDVMGDALQLAGAGRTGTLLITRDFIGRLPDQERACIVHGVPGAPMTFARLKELSANAGLPRRLAEMPVTEFVELRTGPVAGDEDMP